MAICNNNSVFIIFVLHCVSRQPTHYTHIHQSILFWTVAH